jgi:hypothetical protein
MTNHFYYSVLLNQVLRLAGFLEFGSNINKTHKFLIFNNDIVNVLSNLDLIQDSRVVLLFIISASKFF